jgi:RNA polymerase sigma-70 factor, ECF subfamily
VKVHPVRENKTESLGDDELIARIAGGDKAAFRLFVDRHTGLIFSLGWRMLHNRQEAEDVAQETFLRVWQHAGSWQADKGAAVRTWLYRIASNLCTDRYRKTRRERIVEAVPDSADDGQGAQKELENRQTGKIVGQALQTLPERQRAALVLFHYEEMRVAEIASILKTSAKGTENLLYRARINLRRELERQGGIL